MREIFVVGLSDGERNRLIPRVEQIEQAAHGVVEGLRSNNDAELFSQVVLLCLSGQVLSELLEILNSSAETTIPESPAGAEPKDSP